jgi:chromate transport protein ChrA
VPSSSDANAMLRQSIYWLLGCLIVGFSLAKIVGVENVYEPSRYKPPTATSYGNDREPIAIPKRVWPSIRPEPMPTFASNDRSRWATVKALVEEKTYVVGKRENFTSQTEYQDSGIIFQDGYQSLDKIMMPETGLFYSSKPPLFTTLVAGEYFLLNRLFGLKIDQHRWWVVSIILITFNVLPLIVYLVLIAKLVECYGSSDFAKIFAFAVAACATFIVPFQMSLNNHTLGTYCVVFAIYPLLREGAKGASWEWFLSGFFAGLLVTFELPGAALAIGLFIPLLWVRTGRALTSFLPGLLIPVAALLITNYLALGQWNLAYSEFGKAGGPYEYPGSHWLKLKDPGPKTGMGIDFADERKSLYAFHVLFGHHGWFSLTPVWLFAFVGLLQTSVATIPEAMKLLRRESNNRVWSYPLILSLGFLASIVVMTYYILTTNNYGGFSCCARWLIWLTPLWVLGLLPIMDRVGSKVIGRVLAGLAFAASVFSVMYPGWNPWRPPWILQLCEMQGWVQY